MGPMFASRALVGCALLVGAAATARADEPVRPAAYAIIVASNSGGAGQSELRFAEDDAHRVEDVLTQLGG